MLKNMFKVAALALLLGTPVANAVSSYVPLVPDDAVVVAPGVVLKVNPLGITEMIANPAYNGLAARTFVDSYGTITPGSGDNADVEGALDKFTVEAAAVAAPVF